MNGLTHCSPGSCQALQPLNTLIVDDNADAPASLAAVLRAQGRAVTVGINAQSALEEVGVSPPEAFIPDIGLPDMDGYGQAHDKVLAKAAGFQHYLVKPMEMSSLQRVPSSTARHQQ